MLEKQSSLRVLIVNDGSEGAQSLSWLIEGMGHAVITSDRALAMVNLEQFSPDVVLVDLKSPGLQGLEVCHAIRADPHHWHLWVVALSGRGDLRTVEASGASGFDVGIPKPVDAKGLEKLLGQFAIMARQH